MNFEMNSVIHRGSSYSNALRTFQNKRMDFIEQEIRSLDIDTLRLLLCQLCKNGRTLETVTGIAV